MTTASANTVSDPLLRVQENSASLVSVALESSPGNLEVGQYWTIQITVANTTEETIRVPHPELGRTIGLTIEWEGSTPDLEGKKVMVPAKPRPLLVPTTLTRSPGSKMLTVTCWPGSRSASPSNGTSRINRGGSSTPALA